MSEIYIFFGVMLAGLASFLSPCVLPLVVPYLGILGGTTISQASSSERLEPAVWGRLILSSLCFVLGLTTVFVGLGAGASALGQVLVSYKGPLATFANVASGGLIILFGLHFLGLLRIPLLYSDTRRMARMEGASYLGAYTLGLTFAFGWTPCIGPILAAVLTIAGNQASLGSGVKLLLAYSLGLGIPFVLAAVAIRPFYAFLKGFRPYLGRVEQVMGVILIVTGVLILTGSMNAMGQWLLDVFPGLTQLEDWVTPKGLQGAIIKQGQGR